MRTDGVAHSQAVNDLIKTELPKMMAFNSSQVFFTTVSGGSIMMAGGYPPCGLLNRMLTCFKAILSRLK